MRPQTNQTNHQSTHRLAGWLALVPSFLLILYAVTADIRVGRGLIDDWGTGQTILVLVAIAMGALAWVIHRKACRDEIEGKRRYGRTILFIVVPVLVVAGLPLLILESAARILYTPPTMGSSYHQRDPQLGVILAPGKQYRVASKPKAFDVRVRVDENGFRYHDEPLPVDQAEVVVVGDSHPFGWGVAEQDTLAWHLERELSDEEKDVHVLNAGVPGYGPVQSLLRIESLKDRLPAGSTVVCFINPINDLVNLSRDIDYRYPKPYAMLDDGKLKLYPPPMDAEPHPYRFSPAFPSLNDFFNEKPSTRWYESVFYRWLSGADVVAENPTLDGVIQMRDETLPATFLEDDRLRVMNDPARYAARFWPEMSKLDTERRQLLEIARAVFARMKRSTDESKWELLVVLAPEACHYQNYSKHFVEQISEAWTASEIQLGWSRDRLAEMCEELSIRTVRLDESEIEPEKSFVQNDDHTSGFGHQQIAKKIAQAIANAGED